MGDARTLAGVPRPLHPEEYTVHFGLALCHILTGMPEAACEHYELVPPDDFRYQAARDKLAEINSQ